MDHAANLGRTADDTLSDLENPDEVDHLAVLATILMAANGFAEADLVRHDYGNGGTYYGGCETTDGRGISVTIGWTE